MTWLGKIPSGNKGTLHTSDCLIGTVQNDGLLIYDSKKKILHEKTRNVLIVIVIPPQQWSGCEFKATIEELKLDPVKMAAEFEGTVPRLMRNGTLQF